ncbi:MAG: FkbM family methyltransferase [Segetibacter sp.]
MDAYKEELDELLNIKVSDYKEEKSKEWDFILDKIRSEGIVLYGSGGFGKRTLKGLREVGVEPLGFADNNSTVWNKSVEGLTVYSPAEVVEKFPEALYMVTIWSDKIGHPINEVRQILSAKKNVLISSFFPLYYKYPEIFLPYFSLDFPGKTIEDVALVLKAYSLFEDDTSRMEFLAQIRMRMQGNADGLSGATGSQYHFANELFLLNENDSIIDIGAFDGDTLKDFINIRNGEFKKYIAFEPDPGNFKKLEDYVLTLPDDIRNKISGEQLAVSDTNKTITFAADGSLQSAYSEEGNITVDCIALDDHVFNDHPTYIKMDAEGAEPEIIKGASKIIQQFLPILAVSVYHQYDHLWSLPLQIKTLSNDYKFFLRPLCKASWDLICYAVPKNRLSFK